MSIKRGISRFRGKMRFCTPGHKGKLMSADVTEAEGNEEFPASLIAAAQERAAKAFSTHQVRFLTNGSSIGIKASLMAFNGSILAAKNSHQAIFEAAQLANKRLILVENETKNGISLPLTAKQIENALNADSSIGTVVLSHPDYYGLNAQISAAQLVKNSQKMLYVDAAHAAHYGFRPDLFDCKIFPLADAYNLSAHKTLFSLTQTAYLCINNPSLVEKIDHNLKLLGTTSPFYCFFSCLEEAIDYNLSNSHRYDKLLSLSNSLKKGVECVPNDDFTRLVADCKNSALSTRQIYDKLWSRGIIAEKFDSRYIIFILTLADGALKIKRLKKNLEELCGKREG